MPVAEVAHTQQLIVGAQLAVLPNATHLDVRHRTELIVPTVAAFRTEGR